MISSKIPEQNKKLAGSLIPIRCNKIAAVKRSQLQTKSSSQLTVPAKIKGLQGNVNSLKSSKVSENIVNKPNSLATTNLQTGEKQKSIKNLKTEVKPAKREPLKLSNGSTKPVPALQRTLSSNACSKEAKFLNVKKSQIEQEPLKLGDRPAKPVSVLRRNVSSANTCSKEPKSYNVNKSKSQVQPVSQKWSKNQDLKSQNKSKPFKNTQIIGEEKHLKTDNEPKQSKKDESDSRSLAKDFHSAVDRKPSNAHNLPKLPSSVMSNKENLDTLIVEQVKQITEKRKNKVKKEDSHKIQPISQKSEISEDLKIPKNTESVLAQSVAKEKETKLSCSTTSAIVSDSEFQNSKFFKSLILSERDVSPGIMCPELKVSAVDDSPKSPVKKFLPNYSTEEEFLEDLRRNSSNFQRRKGLSPFVPGMKSPAKRYLESFPSVNDFVENLRRNSINLIKRRATLQGSPHLIGNQSSAKKLLDRYPSAKEIVEDLRRNSANFIKRRGKLQVFPFQNTPYERRWTCNVQSSLVKSFPVVKEKTMFQLHKRMENSQHNNPENFSNFQPSALKGSETSKKKDKSKKKVTFYISPPTNNSELTPFSEKLESDNVKTALIQIPEQYSQNSTPEFEANVYRDKENSVVLEPSTKTRNSSTPEFNLEALKTVPSLFLNDSKNDGREELKSTFTPKFDVADLECSNDKELYDPKCEKASFGCFKPIARSSSSSSFTKEFKTVIHPNQNSILNKIADCKNTVKENIPFSCHKSFVSEGQTAIIRPMQQLSIGSYNNISETGPFTVKTDTITPHSLSSYSNSYLLNSLSPPILIDRPSILASYAPICTPLVLKNVSQNSDLNPVRQKLDFEEVKLERRESQIYLQHVPTLQKMYDYLCDQECCMLSLLSSETLVLNRNISNPVADILSNGDEMHFVPLSLSESPISS